MAEEKTFNIECEFEMDDTSARLTNAGGTIVVPIQEFSSAALTKMGDDTGLLPPVTRYITPTGSGIIVERPPSMVKAAFSNGSSRQSKDSYIEFDIPLPWTLYVIRTYREQEYLRISGVGIYWEAHSLASPEDKLIVAPLPNHYNQTTIARDQKASPAFPHFCLGEEIVSQRFDSVSALAIYVLNSIWQSTFNADVVSCLGIGAKLFKNTKVNEPLGLAEVISKMTIEEMVEAVAKGIAMNVAPNSTVEFSYVVDRLDAWNNYKYPVLPASKKIHDIMNDCRSKTKVQINIADMYAQGINNPTDPYTIADMNQTNYF